MLYRYKSIAQDTGEEKSGIIEAATAELAIAGLQRRKLVVVSIVSVEDIPFWDRVVVFEKKVAYRDIVMLSRQISTLFRAQVSALRLFQVITLQVENPILRRALNDVTEDIQAGTSLSAAMGKHPEIFSDFYVNMVRAGEESGNLATTFEYLANYLDRSYALISKTKNALIYPAFVIVVFIAVMILMLVLVIPKLSAIILESGQDLPIYTKIVIALSNFFVHYGVIFFIVVTTIVVFLWRWAQTKDGRTLLGRFELEIPYIGTLFRKLYLARIADNLHTMISSGISMTRAVEIAASVVGSDIYRAILTQAAEDIRGGIPLSAALGKHPDIPQIMVQMVKVGEESAEVANILDTLAKFYAREVDAAVDTVVAMIEPAMIVMLGVGVGGLLTSILLPIYNISASY